VVYFAVLSQQLPRPTEEYYDIPYDNLMQRFELGTSESEGRCLPLDHKFSRIGASVKVRF
jgi:hypothetical protein